MLAVSGTCAATIGLLMTAPLWLLIGVSLVWGYSVVGDSTQFSTLLTELADQSYVGTALTVQMALGFLLTGATIWLVPAVEQAVGWHWALAVSPWSVERATWVAGTRTRSGEVVRQPGFWCP